MTQQQQQTTEAPARRWAHEIVPGPNGWDYAQPKPAETLPRELARYHIARAAGFYAGVEAQRGDWPHGMAMVLAEYQLATIWWWHAANDHADPTQIAVDVVTDLVSPHQIGPNIQGMLHWAGIDPAEIRPYGPQNRETTSTTA